MSVAVAAVLCFTCCVGRVLEDDFNSASLMRSATVVNADGSVVNDWGLVPRVSASASAVNADGTVRRKKRPKRPPQYVRKPAGSQCKNQVINTLRNIDPRNMDCSNPQNTGKCIGAVLANNKDHASKCCSRGTEYDNFLVSGQVRKMQRGYANISNGTVIMIVGIQRDFTTGSFAQPCWSTIGDGFIERIGSLVNYAVEQGALIVATKDYHPRGHCSFAGRNDCNNTKDYQSVNERYVNEFPSHCSFKNSYGKTAPEKAPDTEFCQYLRKTVFKGPAPPDHFCRDPSFVGADFHPGLEKILAGVPRSQLEVVFKGYSKKYDSFSAFSHIKGVHHRNAEEERSNTGGRALSKKRARACHGGWSHSDCYPTAREMSGTSNDALRPLSSILNGRNIQHLYLTGLVYDYCVVETAVFGREAQRTCADAGGWNAHGDVAIVADMTRPAFDGKPGAPYNCKANSGYCEAGEGTRRHYDKVSARLKSNSVNEVILSA